MQQADARIMSASAYFDGDRAIGIAWARATFVTSSSCAMTSSKPQKPHKVMLDNPRGRVCWEGGKFSGCRETLRRLRFM